MEEVQQSNLIFMDHSKQQIQLEAIKPNISEYAKYFFASKSHQTIIYDKNHLYILGKQSTKVIDLGKNYVITQLAYHHQKHMVAFLVTEGTLYCYFPHSKNQLIIKKDCKKQSLISFLFSIPLYGNFMLGEENGIKIYKIEEDKKLIKEVKTIGGKFNSFLYQPYTQTLLGFPNGGDCKQVLTFTFSEEKIKNNFKGPIINIDFDDDENLVKSVTINKNLGIQGSKVTKEVFYKYKNQDYLISVLKINNRPYLLFYFANQGKLKLYPVTQEKQSEITIKLPSDSLPSFNVVDNMLVVHLRNQKITFMYDIKGSQVQMLVSPFPIKHPRIGEINLYTGQFVGKRIILPTGHISKWEVNLPVIYHYLKNEQHVFDFLNRRKNAKMILLKWLRQNLLSFKQINISKFWKLLFAKLVTNVYEERDVVNLLDLYANVFYPLSSQDIIDKQILTNIILQSIRQAHQYQLKIPIQLQRLLTNLLIVCKKYEQLVFLIHNDVIKDSQELSILLFDKGKELNESILETMAMDMASRACSASVFLKLLGKTEQVREMKKFIKAKYENMEVLHFIYCAKYIRCLKLRQQYLKFVRFFILQKFPSTNVIYLDEAESTIKDV